MIIRRLRFPWSPLGLGSHQDDRREFLVALDVPLAAKFGGMGHVVDPLGDQARVHRGGRPTVADLRHKRQP